MLFLLALFMASSAEAGWYGKSFSADTIYRSADGRESRGKIHVSESMVRVENGIESGNGIVQIFDRQSGKAFIMVPATKRYVVTPMAFNDNIAVGGEGTTCSEEEGTQCRRLDEVTINGRVAERWQVERDGVRSLEWIDKEHHFPVRIETAQGVLLEKLYLESRNVDGRMVELWRSRSAEGEMLQWYDPQLNVAIRRQSGRGDLHTLKNIHLRSPDPQLFAPPQGYQQVGSMAELIQ